MNRYGSLDEALVHRRAPVENRVFLKTLLNRMPIDRLLRTDGGITVVRSDGAPDIQVRKGYSVGFQTEEEIVAVVGSEAPRWESRRRPGTWAVDHPLHGRGAIIEAEELAAERGPVKPARGAKRGTARVAKPKAEPKVKPAAQQERVQPVCPNCFMLMALSGVCGNCS
ncbi:hypothetical protein ACFSWE_03255 [Leucobacter albus]|uniref:Uncharacterized protein n=1 Tax=Leucobacter albus TaxID=272210 RepID=A0ABW3TNF5_9MICO